MSIVVRRATVRDAAGIAEVDVESWRSAYQGLLPQAMLNARSVLARQGDWCGLLTSGIEILVATDQDEVEGFAAVGASREAGASAHEGELQAIYVRSSYWSTGVGHLLHEAAVVALAAAGYRQATFRERRWQRAV